MPVSRPLSLARTVYLSHLNRLASSFLVVINIITLIVLQCYLNRIAKCFLVVINIIKEEDCNAWILSEGIFGRIVAGRKNMIIQSACTFGLINFEMMHLLP